MSKVKASFLVMALGLGLVLMGAQATWAYTFTYVGGGFFSQSGANVSDGTDSASDNPVPQWATDYASSSASAGVPNVSGYGDAWGQWYFTGGNSISVEAGGYADRSAGTPGSSVSANGGTVTTNEPGTSTGIFFRIDGGAAGSPVRINYSWDASVMTGDGGTAVLGGGSSSMYISLNGNTRWSHEGIVIGQNGDYWDPENGFFMAQIGDIIGVNLSADASILFSGQSNNIFSMAYNSMQLEAVPLPPAAWLFGSGLLGLLALRGFRPGRRD